ncbi:NAD(P)/FAD-dependent oxidoreductase [Micromonospora sp. CA-244673]|uniref:NAD(P)/FAD-dependent oxidoreductase n=1 Tax=Micromonospora sp. CA-244673 TaxID=3239958 RepID=UPI003D93AC32
MPDVVIVGAGIVGAACAYYAAREGLSVTVLERGNLAGGTTSRGEGNILVSDKEPGPELNLALASRTRWLELAAEFGADPFELEEKGGLVVATSDPGAAALTRFAEGQRATGVEAVAVSADQLHDHEPNLAPGLPAGVLYPQDMQVQPVRAAVSLLAAARSLGATVACGEEVVAAERGPDGRVTAVRTRTGSYPTNAVVNAAGTWGGQVGERLGAPIPILPRRGFILVTEPLPRVVRHKVYSADYVENVASDVAGLETSTVVEGTQGGTVLIGASRERVGFDDTMSVEALRRLAALAVRIFPFLADVRLMRTYHGFRPYCPDHLPVIGADPRVPGVFHACGHEGAGIGLAPATGKLISQMLTNDQPDIDPSAFAPSRFAQVTAG